MTPLKFELVDLSALTSVDDKQTLAPMNRKQVPITVIKKLYIEFDQTYSAQIYDLPFFFFNSLTCVLSVQLWYYPV